MDIIQSIIKFFANKDYSISSKFLGFILIIGVLFFIDNILGFSFYYTNSQKIDQLKTIEELKQNNSSNKHLHNTLNKIEYDIINRKNVINIFLNLFSKEPLVQKKRFAINQRDTVYLHDTVFIYSQPPMESLKIPAFNNQWFYVKSEDSIKAIKKSIELPKVPLSQDSIDLDTIKKKSRDKPTLREDQSSRSQIWHTLSSSFLLLVIFVILPFIPFTEEKFKWNLMLGMIIIMIFTAGLIWLSQYLLGLIPVILNKPWINYILNLVLSSTLWIFIGLYIDKKKKEIKK